MKLIIYTNEHYEEEKALYDLDSEKVIIKGDYYHNKIDQVIEGYLKALYDFNIYVTKPYEESISSSHRHYNQIGFYEELIE